MISIETTILGNLIRNEDFARKVLPFLKPDYFEDKGQPGFKLVFEVVAGFLLEYNTLPTLEAVAVELTGLPISDEALKSSGKLLDYLGDYDPQDVSLEWLLDQTEAFCKRKAVHLGVLKTISIHQDGKSYGEIPGVWQEALAVSFDNRIGHNYFLDAEKRLAGYQQAVFRIPFRLDFFNRITGGGIRYKTVFCLMAPTGVGKSAVMCDFAAHNLLDGKNVLYITMEMSEEAVGERIDANLLDIPLDMLKVIEPALFMRKLENLRKKTIGEIVIKEYGTSTASTLHFRRLLNELRTKGNFVPDIIYIDYLNICASSRIGQGSNVNSYSYVKFIAEEVRGMAVDFNVPVVTATQTNREGLNNSEIEMENVSESIGVPFTVDYLVALISNDELEAKNQLLVKQLKNRYGDKNRFKKFLIGIDRSKMRLYDLEESAQRGMNGAGNSEEDVPIIDKGRRRGLLDFSGVT